MSNRAERRRKARAEQKGRHQPVLLVGDGIAAASLTGSQYEATPGAQLPAKVPGKHRWVATGAWVIDESIVADAFDPDRMKLLDNQNLMHLGIGCWDCERPLGVIDADSRCPAEGDD